jgi:hypothetical protein
VATSVDGGRVRNRRGDLVCFKAHAASRVRTSVQVSNPFSSGMVDTVGVRELCLPALVAP